MPQGTNTKLAARAKKASRVDFKDLRICGILKLNPMLSMLDTTNANNGKPG